jgi:hypothetical protein
MEATEPPYLVFRRTGRTIAAVLAFGFGGGTVLLGLLSSLSGAPSVGAVLGAVRGYFLAALPFFAAAAVLAACRRELWFVPEARALRMLTFRPWQLGGPRVEEAPLSEYRAVRMQAGEGEGAGSTVVALVTERGEAVPVRETDRADEGRALAEELAKRTGLPLVGTSATDGE